MTYLWNPGNSTPVNEVSMLGPGEAMLVSQGQCTSRFSWYQLPVFNRSMSCVPPLIKPQYIQGTEDYLRQAVHRQLIADVPVGAFLSGGLDSSSVVAFARERNPDLRCFTIEVSGTGDEGFSDDLPYARRVANHLGVPLEVVDRCRSHGSKLGGDGVAARRTTGGSCAAQCSLHQQSGP